MFLGSDAIVIHPIVLKIIPPNSGNRLGVCLEIDRKRSRFAGLSGMRKTATTLPTSSGSWAVLANENPVPIENRNGTIVSTPGGSRTPNPQLRRLMLYPVELRVQQN